MPSDGLELRERWARWHGLEGWKGGCRCRECRDAAALAAAASAPPAKPPRAGAAGAGSRWFMCRCGRKLYEHAMRTVPSTGGRELVCGLAASGRFEPETGQDYGPESGLRVKA